MTLRELIAAIKTCEMPKPDEGETLEAVSQAIDDINARWNASAQEQLDMEVVARALHQQASLLSERASALAKATREFELASATICHLRIDMLMKGHTFKARS
jgi:hypothetical protein